MLNVRILGKGTGGAPEKLSKPGRVGSPSVDSYLVECERRSFTTATKGGVDVLSGPVSNPGTTIDARHDATIRR